MGLLLLIIPIVSAALFFALKENRRAQHALSIVSAALLFAVGMFMTAAVFSRGIIRYNALGNFFYVDALSMIVLDLVLTIGFAVSIYSVGYLEEEIRSGKWEVKRLHLYYALMYLFFFTMVLALTVDNMGVMWIAIEGTTLASAFLVGFQNDKHSLEAAWKYIIICSVGIAIALLGIILLHLSSIDVLKDGDLLDWTALYENAGALKSEIVRLAFLFILIGFGTKAGLAPMHTWLPDAHSQAPSPVSALLSGVLLNSAMYGIIRTIAIVNRNLGNSDYTGRLMIAAGLLSILAAAVFILTQKDYKRLLAYSSIEHMGIIAIAIGCFTPLSVFAGLFHMVNHSLTKSMLFLSAGTVMQKYHTKKIGKVSGLLKTLPVTGVVFLLGLFAIAGVPPFSVFASELNIMIAMFTAERFVTGTAVVLLLAVVFAGIAATLFRMFYGEPPEAVIAGETDKLGTAVILLLLTLICITGLFVPDALISLLFQARDIVVGR